MKERINCIKCIHYYSTWDSYAPRGCRVYNMKTAQIPAFVVKAESGEDCRSYEIRKSESEEQDKKLDLNDESNW